MRVVSKKSALKTIYYLMSVDGDVSQEELASFGDIGNQLADNFVEIRDEIIEDCEKQLINIFDEEDYYDVIIEGTDQALLDHTDERSDGVTSRLLLWNLLVIAFSNNNFDNLERRLIKHIVRILEIDRSIFIEMEHLIKTNEAVMKELSWIKSSNRTYEEVSPIVAELENRKKIILSSATSLIEDELYIAVEKMKIPPKNAFENVRDTMGEKITTSPVASEFGKQTQKIFDGFKTWNKGSTGGQSTVPQANESFIPIGSPVLPESSPIIPATTSFIPISSTAVPCSTNTSNTLPIVQTNSNQ